MKLNYLNLGNALAKLSGLVVFLFSTMPSVQAEKITIGKGSGVVWEGQPFNASMSYLIKSDVAYPYHGLIAVSDYFLGDRNCTQSERLYKVDGYTTIKITEGVGLIPRAVSEASYKDGSGVDKTINGTIGLPRTRGVSDSFIIRVPFTNGGVSYDYCIPMRNFASSDGPQNNAFKRNSLVRASVSGSWAIVADGSQMPKDNISIDPIYATSRAASEHDYREIFPTKFDLRVSTLSCTVDTPVNINFFAVGRNIVPHAELAKISNELYVSCAQDSALFPVKANINVQFRPISGLYNGEVNKLELYEKGGYITGTIPGVTSTGICGTNDGITFNNQQIKVGAIEEHDSNITLHHRLDWRLCSAGSSLPTGKVTASAEMLVTYN